MRLGFNWPFYNACSSNIAFQWGTLQGLLLVSKVVTMVLCCRDFSPFRGRNGNWGLGEDGACIWSV